MVHGASSRDEILRDARTRALCFEVGRQDPASHSADISSATIRGGVTWVSPESRSRPLNCPREGHSASHVVIDLRARPFPRKPRTRGGQQYEHLGISTGGIVIIFGLILLLIGFVTGIAIVWTIGVIVLLVGLALWILGSLGHAVGGRHHYY